MKYCFLVCLLLISVTAEVSGQEYRAPRFEFEGSSVVKTAVLDQIMVECSNSERIDSDDGRGILYCFEKVKPHYWKQGNLRAKVASIRLRALGNASVVTVSVDEGNVFRFSGYEFETEYFSENARIFLDTTFPVRIGEVAGIDKDISRVRVPEDVQHEHTELLGIDIVPVF